MARAFTTEEVAAIRDCLLATGAELFGARGVRRTTVDDLARSAGISKGAFYGFFASKEALFVQLVADYEAGVHAEIEAAIRRDPGHGLEVMIETALRATERNPLMGVAMSEEGLAVLRALPDNQRAAFVERDVHLVDRALAILGDEGVELGVPAEVVVGLLRALVMVGWHRRDIGDELLDEVVAWLVPALRSALLGGDRRRSRG
jgi:AcrR family transcriptional regulator